MKSVLIVDDDRVILNLLAEGLRDSGYDVSIAVSGEEALKLVDCRDFDLVVLDMRMPVMSGIELARKFASVGRPPFVFLSAFDDASVVREAADVGAMGYLIKPVDVPQLVPFIEASIARARDIEALRNARDHLEKALTLEQNTRTAVGIIMVRKGLDRKPAFNYLRTRARSQRRKIGDVAEEFIASLEDNNRILCDEK
ncbi:MAG: response regulator [Azoarcus sp.]|nr:response regulator [Azoarcus sp.]